VGKWGPNVKRRKKWAPAQKDPDDDGDDDPDDDSDNSTGGDPERKEVDRPDDTVDPYAKGVFEKLFQEIKTEMLGTLMYNRFPGVDNAAQPIIDLYKVYPWRSFVGVVFGRRWADMVILSQLLRSNPR
jgi:hypothetical protein